MTQSKTLLAMFSTATLLLATTAFAGVEIKGVQGCYITLNPITVNGVSNQKVTLKSINSYRDSKLPLGQNSVTFQSGSYSCKQPKIKGDFKLQQPVTLSDAVGKSNFAKFDIYMNHEVTVTTGNYLK